MSSTKQGPAYLAIFGPKAPRPHSPYVKYGSFTVLAFKPNCTQISRSFNIEKWWEL
jgi:hypothetical protein